MKMMKKVLAVALVVAIVAALCICLTACNDKERVVDLKAIAKEDIKIGLITLHDENSTYDKNFIDAMYEAVANLGLNKDTQLIISRNIPEGNECYNAAVDLVENGCNVIFADSFGHEQYLMQAAWEYPDVRFCHATGTKAHTAKYGNYYNAFASIYQGRYLAGVAAGMKLQEMVAAGKITDDNKDDNGNIKLGYVGAFAYAEVVSGYTSWYLGVKSIVPKVAMDVTFTGSWYDPTAEQEGAESLIARGCAIISQHADSMGAPNACEKKGVPNVSYNGSTVATCRNTFIVSSRINWAPYYEYVVGCAVNGTEIKVDWTGDLSTGSVLLTEVGPAAAAGTQAKLDEVTAKLVSGEIKVFDCNNFTVNNSKLTSYLADVDDMGDFVKETEAIVNGGYFAESAPEHRSAPYFDIKIDGITLLN